MLRTTLFLFIALWAVFVVVPVALLVLWSFLEMKDYSFSTSLSLDAYAAVFDSGRYEVTLRTLRIAGTVTAIELGLALPFALWLAKGVRSPLLKAMVLALLTVPFFISLASRTIVWRSVLSRSGLVNTALMHLGIIDQPLDWLLFSEFSVHLGLLAPSFPTMVLPVFLSISLIDDELIEAARDLGASPVKVLGDVILPLALPGIVAGIIFTFVPLLGETVVPQLLGGGRVAMLGASITSLLQVLNYPVAAALAALVLGILAALFLALRLIGGGSIAAVFEGMKR
ncbi:ABC transporter permease [Ancylobacter sp. TS-1]|uniref:ABC transporter permease n=1 Tax=Ancylobacter sp. TS-1 TaxID=1850374 RepID=UPI001265AD16|nr:ABC transporter permease [Ancylobacter sp. TS-1]QFR33069.1 ABC transporter permease subunit [Ancylobacter sp. TS-1]